MNIYSVSTRHRPLVPGVVVCAMAFLTASSWTVARAHSPLPGTAHCEPTSLPKVPEVSDFRLLEQSGRFHPLDRVNAARAVVLRIAGNSRPVFRQNAANIKALRDQFPEVQIWMLHANPKDDRASIVEEANNFADPLIEPTR